MFEIIIRKYKADDEAALRNIVSAANHNYIENLAEYERGHISIAEYNGVIAGYLWARLGTGNCQVFIHVAPEYRRHGIGTALYNEAERQCREKNENELYSSQYYDEDYETGKAFADSVGCQFVSGSTYMINKTGILPEDEEKRRMIREYREEDAARVHQIVARGFNDLNIRLGYPNYMCILNDELNEERRKEYNELAKDGAYVLEDGGEIVGYGCIGGKNIGSLAVDTSKNNNGYGKTLALFMTNELFRRGNETAELWCEYGNDNARHIYYSLGYREIETGYTSFKKFE